MINLISIIAKIWSKLPKYQSLLPDNLRTGTKVSICIVVFNCIMITWLVIGIPWLTIFYPVLQVYAQYISSIITALISGVAVVHSVSEVRKTIENIRNVTREEDGQQ